MSIPIEQFLEANDFEVLKDIKIEPLDPKKVKEIGDISFSTTEFIKSEVLDGMVEAAAKADQSDQPFTPSFQPLNEAGLLTAGETLNKSAVGSTSNNSLGIQNSSINFLGETAKFGTETDLNLTEESKAQIEDAQKTLATGTLGLANSLDLAEGGIKFSSTNMSFGAANILMGTNGTMHLASPIISTVAKVETKQAGTIQQTADIITDNAKNKVVQVEGLNSSIAANTMTTSLDGQINVSNYSTNTSVQKIVNTSNVVQNIGGELVQNRSKGIIANQADGAITTQAADISITASAGSLSSIGNGIKSLNPLEDNISFEDTSEGYANITAVDPTGKTTTFLNVNQSKNNTPAPKWQQIGGLEGRNISEIAPTQTPLGGGNISIISNKGTTTIINNNMVMSSNGSSNQTVGGNIIQNAKGSATLSANFTNIESQVGTTVQTYGYIRQQAGSTGTLISNGFTFAGFRFPQIKRFVDQIQNIPLQIREIPNLPSLPPGISYQDLESCIPSKYKPSSSSPIDGEPTTTSEAPNPINAPTVEEAGRREKQFPLPVGNEQGSVIEAEGINSAIEGEKSNRNNSNTVLSSNTSPTDQSNVLAPNKVIGAAGVLKGGSDVFTKDKDDGEDIYNRLEQQAEELTLDDETIKTIESFIKAIDKTLITDIAKSKLIGPKDYELLFNDNDIDIIKKYIASKLLKDTKLITENELKIIEEYISNKDKPNLKIIIEDIQKDIENKVAIGGVIGVLSSAYNRVNNNIGIVNDLVDSITTRDTFNIIKNTSTWAGTLTEKEIFSDINSIINSSPTLTNLYNQINNSTNISTAIDTINFQDIESIISKGLNTIGIENLQVAEDIASILNNIKNSEEYKKEGLSTKVILNIINNISIETGLSNKEATEIYNQGQDIIALILEGKVQDAALSAELTNVVGFFIGESNAALATDLQNLYLGGIKSLNQASNTVNSVIENGKDIYNTVSNIYTQLKAIPALIGLMNSYEMPVLTQVQTIFKCFELMKQVNNIIDSIDEISNSIDNFKNIGKDITDLFKAFDTLENNTTSNNTNNNEFINNSSLDSISNIQDSNLNKPSILEKLTEGLSTGSIVGSGKKQKEKQSQTSIVNLNKPNNIVDTVLNEESCSLAIVDRLVNTNHSNDHNHWRPVRNNIQAVDIIEKLPRIIQIFNSVKETPVNSQAISKLLTEEQVKDLKQTFTVPQASTCFIAPKLNLLEATIEVIEIKNNILLYKMSTLDVLRLNNKNIFPTTNTIAQLYIDTFYDNITGAELKVQRNFDFFSPILYNFKTISFHKERNIGLAYLLTEPNRIHLKNNKNITYNYSITDIGNRLNPNILDAYIIA